MRRQLAHRLPKSSRHNAYGHGTLMLLSWRLLLLMLKLGHRKLLNTPTQRSEEITFADDADAQARASPSYQMHLAHQGYVHPMHLAGT